MGFQRCQLHTWEQQVSPTSTPDKVLTNADQVWFQSFVKGQQPRINEGKTGLQRLDYVVKSAEKHGISLIIPFVNNWKDYGGMPAYINYYGGRADNNSNWYHSAPAQQQYQKYIKAVVKRYMNSSAIFAWELCNEPRCKGCNTDVIANWASKTAKYIKNLDRRHMVTLGDEGFGLDGGGDNSYPFQYGEGSDFVKNLKIKELDFGVFHFYPDSCE
jgi:mannan endo-1,4-beta-mannosidase